MASRLDDLIREHAERLDRFAGQIALSDVTSKRRPGSNTLTLLDIEPTPSQSDARHRWSVIAIAAAAAIVFAVGVFTARDDDPPGESAADQAPTVPTPVGFIGLPPVGALPSTPQRGTLVLDVYPCTSVPPFEGLSVLADGRLVSRQSGRLVEQRLTPEGVELMRSELLDSGVLGTHDDDDNCVDGAYHGHIGDGDETYADGFTAPMGAHVGRLVDPWSWLPATAWEDRQIKAFVPSEYLIDITGPQYLSVSLEHLAARLPAAAEALVLAKPWGYQMNHRYTSFTTDEARALAAALDAAGYQQYENVNANLEYHSVHEDPPIYVLFSPRLPHEVGRGPAL